MSQTLLPKLRKCHINMPLIIRNILALENRKLFGYDTVCVRYCVYRAGPGFYSKEQYCHFSFKSPYLSYATWDLESCIKTLPLLFPPLRILLK
jgi:hypothetical protein